MKRNAIRQWLLKIAQAVEDWPTMRKDSVEAAMVTQTPEGAMRYSATHIQDATERTAVQAALPALDTEDFAAAAKLIRQSAEALSSWRAEINTRLIDGRWHASIDVYEPARGPRNQVPLSLPFHLTFETEERAREAAGRHFTEWAS